MNDPQALQGSFHQELGTVHGQAADRRDPDSPGTVGAAELPAQRGVAAAVVLQADVPFEFFRGAWQTVLQQVFRAGAEHPE